MSNLIDSYLRELERELRAKGIFNADTLAELESHLLDSAEANARWGMDQAEAEKEALRRFGSVDVISSTFEKERISLKNITGFGGTFRIAYYIRRLAPHLGRYRHHSGRHPVGLRVDRIVRLSPSLAAGTRGRCMDTAIRDFCHAQFRVSAPTRHCVPVRAVTFSPMTCRGASPPSAHR